MHRLSKSKFALRAITALNSSRPAASTVRSVHEEISSTIFSPSIGGGAKSDKPLRFYPSFPFAYFSNPTMLSGSCLVEVVGFEKVVSDVDGTIYADSVKKKRKRKMNKHKYKKLRKRLRRKT